MFLVAPPVVDDVTSVNPFQKGGFYGLVTTLAKSVSNLGQIGQVTQVTTKWLQFEETTSGAPVEDDVISCRVEPAHHVRE